MIRATFVPHGDIQLKPAYWGVNRNLQEVMENMDQIWDENKYSATEMKETDQAYLMCIDFPGANKKNLDIQVEGETLFITATKKLVLADNEETQNISKNVSLPKEVDREKIQAHCEDGVLYLALPKIKKAQPKKINISSNMNHSIWNNLLDESANKKAD